MVTYDFSGTDFGNNGSEAEGELGKIIGGVSLGRGVGEGLRDKGIGSKDK